MRPSSVLCIAAQLGTILCVQLAHRVQWSIGASREEVNIGGMCSVPSTWGGAQYMGQLVEPMGTWALCFFFLGGGLGENSRVLKIIDINSHTLR